jgi:hypothetical protein
MTNFKFQTYKFQVLTTNMHNVPNNNTVQIIIFPNHFSQWQFCNKSNTLLIVQHE